ncbi:MAG: DUF5076 domain-containing protein [Henriciella sp.]
MSDQHNSLSKPASIPTDKPAQEYVRFWIANNQEHVNLLVGDAGDPAKEPTMWGFMLADIAKHVTKALSEKNPDGPSATEIMDQILGGIAGRIKHAPTLGGSTKKVDG